MEEGIVLYSKQHESKSWQLGTGLYRWMALEDLRDAVIWEIFMTKKDWYEAGDQIRNLVQDAIDKEDFSQLSSTISIATAVMSAALDLRGLRTMPMR